MVWQPTTHQVKLAKTRGPTTLDRSERPTATGRGKGNKRKLQAATENRLKVLAVSSIIELCC